MEREACVCDHGLERLDLGAEIIIIIIIIIITIIIIMYQVCMYGQHFQQRMIWINRVSLPVLLVDI